MPDTNQNPAPPRDFPAHAVAIVGFSGRFPGARDLEEFWQNVRNGVEALEPFSAEQLEAARVEPGLRNDPAYVKQGTVLEGADLFDAAFFGLPPREAQIMDPQQRIFLECAWEALEHAGYAATSDRYTVGVYAGQGLNTYLMQHVATDPVLAAAVGGYQLMIGNDKDFLCTRVSYKLDLRGPSVTVQTACSTSLVAVVMACRALARGECDVALAGGVAVPFPQRSGYLYQEGMILSPDGHCRPFDAAAAGTRPGAGCGIVVLKRLADAIADRDTIHAVIRGAAINNDGAGKAGFTAPSVDGQAEVIATAQALAGVEPRSIGYMEAHGTGTPLGDPIEIAALTQVFRASTDDVGFCRLGSLKANLGHLDIAAGVAALIKTVLVLKNRELPPLVNFTRPNPQLALDDSPFMASAAGAVWPANGSPRRAGVSAFGIGGTNSHVVLEESGFEESDAPDRGAPSREAHLLLLSARTATALESMTAALARHLSGHPQTRLEDVEWTLQGGRRLFPHRRAVVVRDSAQAVESLTQPQRPPVFTGLHEGGDRPVAFLFSGQGSQYAGMSASLYASEAVYRSEVDRCAGLLAPHLGLDIREVLLSRTAGSVINETRLAQPTLFVVEYALAQLWKSWGVQPTAMLGHSIGEFVAAHLAGVMLLEDALAVVAARGRLMQALPSGSMAAVHLPADDLRTRLLPGVEIAALNAPGLCTISGPPAAMAAVLQQLQGAGVEARALHTSHAFHSQMMDPVLSPFTRLLEGIALAAPAIPYVSNVTGTWITVAQATSPGYYAEHLRRAVKFEAGVRTLAADPALALLEVGPGNVLTTLARLTVGKDAPKRVLQSTGRPQEERADTLVIREAAGKLWLTGVPLDWAGLHATRSPRRVPLPTYPFERKRFWVDPAASVGVPPLQTVARPEGWTSAPAWVRDEVACDEVPRLGGTWLVFGADEPLAREVVRRVKEAGGNPVLAGRGDRSEDIAALVDRLQKEAAYAAAPITGAIYLGAVGSGEKPGAEGVYAALIALGVGLGSCLKSVVRVLHITRHAETLLNEPLHDPATALARGPILVLPAEFPHLRMRGVDLDPSIDAFDVAAAAATVVAEAGSSDEVQQVAWRGGRRWMQRYESIELPSAAAESLPLKKGGVYVITGGLGGIGLTLAGWLAARFEARVLLTARSGLPPRDEWDAWLASHPPRERTANAITAVRGIEASGGEALVVAADAADEAAMSAALKSAVQRWGRLDGVIHAAGIAGSGSLAALQTPADARNTFGPKLAGLDVLVRLLGTTRLDFVALMSSINSVLGAAGTCDYAAANAVLDAFAVSPSRPVAWRHVVSFNWSAWREVGMAANLAVPEARKAQWQAFLATAIAPHAGAEAFGKGLAARRSRVIVSSFDVAEASRKRELKAPLAAAEIPRAADTQARPELATAYDAPETEMERRLAVIWSELLGVDPIGRHDDFFALGGHSLLATRILARVQESLGSRLTLREVFDFPTVNKMASRIEAVVVTASAEEREELEF